MTGADTRTAEQTTPPTVRRFERDGRGLTGIRITRARSGQQRRLMQLQQREGYKVRGGELSVWKWNGTVEADGYLYATFPETGPLRPMDSLSRSRPAEALRSAEEFLYSYTVLREREETAGKLIPEAVFIGEEGFWHFLPAGLAAVIAEELGIGSARPRFAGYAPHQRMVGAALLFLYRSLTGRSPFDEHETIAAHPHLYRPEIRQECADLLYRPFATGVVPELEDASKTISLCRRESWREELSEDALNERSILWDRELHRLSATLRRRNRLRRIAPPVGTALAAAAVLIFLFSPMRGGPGGEDPTIGLSPKEVIRLYYGGMNRLDPQTMESCTVGNPDPHHIREVTTLYVVSRVRQGVERTEVFISADEWEERGRPDLAHDAFVYGIQELSVRLISREDEETVRYRATYKKYSTLPPMDRPAENAQEASQVESTGTVEIARTVEAVTLERRKDETWKISGMEVEEREVVERVGGASGTR